MEELINILNSNDEDTYCIGMHILDNTDLRRLRPECIGMLKVWIRDENFVILTQHLNKDWIRWFKKLRNRVWNLYGL